MKHRKVPSRGIYEGLRVEPDEHDEAARRELDRPQLGGKAQRTPVGAFRLGPSLEQQMNEAERLAREFLLKEGHSGLVKAHDEASKEPRTKVAFLARRVPALPTQGLEAAVLDAFELLGVVRKMRESLADSRTFSMGAQLWIAQVIVRDALTLGNAFGQLSARLGFRPFEQDVAANQHQRKSGAKSGKESHDRCEERNAKMEALARRILRDNPHYSRGAAFAEAGKPFGVVPKSARNILGGRIPK